MQTESSLLLNEQKSLRNNILLFNHLASKINIQRDGLT